ncbi:MAG: ADP-ribosylglycohydrolase family protein [Thermomicrobiales bacterium]
MLGKLWIDYRLHRAYGDGIPRRAKSGRVHPPRDQALLLLESIRKHDGFERDPWAADWREYFESYEGYFDAATKQTLRHLQAGDPVETAGSDSTEMAGASRIAAVVYRYWDSPDRMMEAAKQQTDVTHHTPIIVDTATFIVHAVEAIKDGESPVRSLRTAAAAGDYAELPASEWLEKGLSEADSDSTEAIGEFGRSCDIRGTFPAVAQLTARYE